DPDQADGGEGIRRVLWLAEHRNAEVRDRRMGHLVQDDEQNVAHDELRELLPVRLGQLADLRLAAERLRGVLYPLYEQVSLVRYRLRKGRCRGEREGRDYG